MVQECDDLLLYFPDIEDHQIPERRFLMGILWTKRKEEMRNLIKTARSNRSISNIPDENDLIQMTPGTKDEIMKLLPHKSKMIIIYSHDI